MIDCHAHLASERFDADRDEVLARARAAGIEHILVVSEGPEEVARVLEVCAPHPQLHPCIGLHPDRWSEDEHAPPEVLEQTLSLIRAHADDLIAVGEVGLDYWYGKSEASRAAQAHALRQQALLAMELDMPLNVHSRSAGKYTIELLAELGCERVLLHGFDGKAGHALRAHEQHGWLVSIPTSVVRSKQKQKLARAMPLSALVLETDSPVLGPVRTERNEPANIVHVVEHLARVKRVSEVEVVEVTTANARRLFGL